MSPRSLARALYLSPLLLLLADTKFRLRDPGATLAGAVDAQIVFEILILGICGAVGLLALTSLPVPASRGRRSAGVLLAYAALALVSTAWSPIRAVTFVRGVELGAVVIAAIAVGRCLSPAQTLRSLATFVPLYVLLSSLTAFGLPGTVTGVLETYRGVVRFSWFAVHPSLAATFGAVAVIVLVPIVSGSWPWEIPRWQRGVAAAAAVVLALIVALTRARTEAAALAVALVAMFIRRWLRPRSRVAVTALLVAGGLGFWLLVSPWIGDAIDLSELTETEVAAFLLRGQTLEELATVSGRMDLWRIVFPLVLEDPFLGHGYVSSRAVLLESVPWASYAHNALLQSLLDLGLLGTVLIWGLALRALWLGATSDVGRRLETIAVGQVVFGILVFQLLAAASGESFVGVPGFRVFLFAVCALLAERLWAAPRADRIG